MQTIHNCEPCQYSTYNNGTYKDHLKSKKHQINIGTIKVNYCNLCDKQYNDRSYYMKHLSNIHNIDVNQIIGQNYYMFLHQSIPNTTDTLITNQSNNKKFILTTILVNNQKKIILTIALINNQNTLISQPNMSIEYSTLSNIILDAYLTQDQILKTKPNNKISPVGYIYLIRKIINISEHKPYFKIGYTSQLNPYDRFKKYGNNCEHYLMVKIKNAVCTEYKLKKIFNIIFGLPIEGDETFSGDPFLMTNIIKLYINKYQLNIV